MKTHKTRMISLRLTEAQYEQLMARLKVSGYKSRTRFIIETILGSRPVAAKLPEGSDKEIRMVVTKLNNVYVEMVKEGTNLNQLVAAINKMAENENLEYLNWGRLYGTSDMAKAAARKLSWRSYYVYGLAERIESHYLPCEE